MLGGFLSLLLLGVASAAEPGEMEPYTNASLHVRTYYDEDGLPQNSVESMSLDPDGRLWITTRDGGAVFDGTAWVVVPMPDPRVSNWPRVVRAVSDGSVWFGIEPDGLARYHSGDWKSWDATTGLRGNVSTILEHEGVLLVATTEGIFSVRLESPTPVMELGETDVRAMASDGNRVLAVTASGELIRRGEAGWIEMSLPRIDGANPFTMLMSGGRIIIGTSHGVFTYENGSERVVALPDMSITSLAESTLANGDSTLWAGTEGSGLFRLENGSWIPAGSAIALPDRYVYSLVAAPGAEATEHLFVGTLSGIGRVDLAGWRKVSIEDGLPQSSAVSLMESRVVSPGAYFIGTTGGLAIPRSDGEWTTHPCTWLRGGSVFSMLESESATALYFGTESGVVAVAGGNCSRLGGLEEADIVSLVETGTDPTRLWAGTYGEGLWSRGDDGAWSPIPHELPDQRIEALAVSGDDRETLWIATNRGLARVSHGRLELFDSSSGLPHDLVRSILVQPDRIWVGTSSGLAWARPGEQLHWHSVSLRADGRLQNDTVYRIEVDRKGRIHAFTGRGVARLVPEPETDSYRVGRIFLSDDGLPSNETNFGASMVDSKGRLWAGTPRGVGIYDPELDTFETSMPGRLAITATIEPHGIPVEDGDVLAYDENRVVASFRLVDLAHGPRAVYRTQLAGLEDEPESWMPSAQRTFTKLRGGRYELRVWARDPHGHEAGPASLSFFVQPPPWASWWAVLIYVATAVLLLYTLVGLRIRTLRRRNEDLELIVRSRTRDLEVANRQLESANVTLADMSVTDPLTGAKNRRHLLQEMEEEAVRVRRSTRDSDDMVFILVDIDRFKILNDRFGHATGDLVLRRFNRVLARAVRETDTIVRWGGEEFLIVARRISRSESEILVERILQMVREERFESTDSSRHLRLTCSIGYAAFPFVTSDRALFTWEQVVDIADHGLYAVKRSGRDGWVGLAAGPQLRADSFLSRLRDDVGAMVESGEVSVTTSFDDSGALSWR